MYQIEMNIPSKSKKIINQMIIEQNGFGGKYIARKITNINQELNQLWEIPKNLRLKVLRLLIKDHIKSLNDSGLPEGMKNHFANFIKTLGKEKLREIQESYVVIDHDMNRISDKICYSQESARRATKRLERIHQKTYNWTTLKNYMTWKHTKNYNK